MRLRGVPASRSRDSRPPATSLAITPTTVGFRRVLEVAGQVDLATAPSFTAALQAALASGEREIWVDLTGVTFMDSSGLHALLAARHRLQPDGHRLAVIAPPGPVRRLLELTAVDRILVVLADRSSAHQHG
jgi:anti-sigma B factor antagonist